MPINLSRFRWWADLPSNLSRIFFMIIVGEKSCNLLKKNIEFYPKKSHNSGEVDRQICLSPKSCPFYSRWTDLSLLRISLYLDFPMFLCVEIKDPCFFVVEYLIVSDHGPGCQTPDLPKSSYWSTQSGEALYLRICLFVWWLGFYY